MTPDGRRPPSGPSDDGIVDVELNFPSFRQFQSVFRGNLSREGLFIPRRDPLPTSSVVRFRVKLPEDFILLEGVGVVSWTRERSRGPEHPSGMAVRFASLAPQSQELIDKLVDTQIAEGGRPFELEPTAESEDFIPTGALAGPDTPIAENVPLVAHHGKGPSGTHRPVQETVRLKVRSASDLPPQDETRNHVAAAPAGSAVAAPPPPPVPQAAAAPPGSKREPPPQPQLPQPEEPVPALPPAPAPDPVAATGPVEEVSGLLRIIPEAAPATTPEVAAALAGEPEVALPAVPAVDAEALADSVIAEPAAFLRDLEVAPPAAPPLPELEPGLLEGGQPAAEELPVATPIPEQEPVVAAATEVGPQAPPPEVEPAAAAAPSAAAAVEPAPASPPARTELPVSRFDVSLFGGTDSEPDATPRVGVSGVTPEVTIVPREESAAVARRPVPWLGLSVVAVVLVGAAAGYLFRAEIVRLLVPERPANQAATGGGAPVGWSPPPAVVTRTAASEAAAHQPTGVVPEGVPTEAPAPPPAPSVAPTVAPTAAPAPTPVPQPERRSPATRVEEIAWSVGGGATVVVIRGNGALSEGMVSVTPMVDPPRVLVRLRPIETKYARYELKVGSPEVSQIRTGHHPEQKPPALYVVLDLTGANIGVSGSEISGAELRVTLTKR